MTTRSNAIRATLPATRLNLDEAIISKMVFRRDLSQAIISPDNSTMHDAIPFSADEADIDRQIRIARMKDELDEIAGGEVLTGGFGPASSALEEIFLKQALVFERAELDTEFNRLARRGVIMVPPAELDHAATTARLWEIIRELARMRCFLYNTDHLSDRELYDWLWSTGLRDETPDRGGMPDTAWHTSPIGAGSDEDIAIHLKYYATDEERDRWSRDFPEDAMPKRATLPFDRDRDLPNHAPF
jgi:hypothetical protein